MPYPANYTIPLTTDAGNRVVGVYIKANIPEKELGHERGFLFHCRTPIKVYSSKKDLLFSSNLNGKKLVAINLPKTAPRYSLPSKDYNAVFIEIRSKADENAEGLKWEEKPKASKLKKECWSIRIHKRAKAKFSMGDKEGFAVSQVALKITQHIDGKLKLVKPLPQLPHFAYYLQPQQRYQLEALTPTDTFIVEVPTGPCLL